jgi:N-acetylneuraminate lyase
LSLTVKDRRAQAERWVDAAPDGFKVIIHVGHTCQEESRALAAHAAEIGAWGIGEIGPVFFRPSSVEALADYCAATASAAPALPYYFYHMPSMNQVLFPMVDFLRACSDVPNMAGIKYTYEDLADYAACRAFENGRYDILFGRDEWLLHGLAAGAEGAVGSTYNAVAPLYHAIVKAFRDGNLQEARRLQALSAEMIRLFYATGSLASSLRCAMRLAGFDFGPVRRPQLNLAEEVAADLEKALRELGVLEYLNAGG